MSIKTLGHAISRKATKQVLTVQKHSPVLLIGVGLIGVGTSMVLACRATLKASDILEEGEKNKSKFEHATRMMDEGRETELTDEEKNILKKGLFGIQLRVAFEITKKYAPAIALGVASVGAMAGSHIILQRRNAGLAAALGIAHKGFEQYRSRVVEELGSEKDLEFRYGTIEETVIEETPEGPVAKTIKRIDNKSDTTEVAYAQFFDPENVNWRDIPNQNTHYIQGLQQHFNNRLRLDGVVVLNDVYEALGFKKTKAGHLVGWVRDAEEGDNFIDFIIVGDKRHRMDFAKGRVMELMIDFNVQGNILDHISEL
jgi:hypothetical protein